MLQAIRPEGAKPPFFVVHGFHGAVAIARIMGRVLDHDRPLYVLHARGIDGTEPPHERMEDMLGGYLAEIRAARPRGPYILGGVCAGGLVAMRLASTLAAQGEQVGPVVLMDPPAVPASLVPGNRDLDPKANRGVYHQLHASVEHVLRGFAEHFGELPFDVNDPAQLERAIEVGIAMIVKFCRYVPPPFDGATEFIISGERTLGHFHPEGPWKNIVPKPGRIHVIPGSHVEFFYNHLDEVLRLVQFALDSAFRA